MSEFTNEGFHVCSYCECDKQTHVYFWKCPLLENELVCCECCLDEVSKDEAITKLAEITGMPKTREQIDTICRACAHRPV